MTRLKERQVIGIPCDVSRGAFPDERLITMETISGPISGFVRQDAIIEVQGKTYVSGVIIDISEDSIAVRVRGSFFTTTGLAYLSKEWAASNIREAV